MSRHSRAAPKVISLETLKEITNNFSTDRELGSGTFGIVYKGVQDGEEIAVKQLQTQGHDDHEEFMKEFGNLWRLRHPNVVQLLGYCYEIKREVVALGDGRFVWADNIYRALCFEYMHNGSLRKHLYDEYHGHDWQTRFKIIKGTCEGLKYLHEGLERPMYHLDLKPENILLDKNMVPKLADFGLSKLVHNNQTQVTESCIGTRGYLPPEYIEDNLVSNKLDIFSLGVVMIRIIAGFEAYYEKFRMSSQAFIERVCANWRNRLQGMLGCTSSLEAACHQVKGCIEIAINCVDADRQKRPTIGKVVCRLNELEHDVIDMSAAPCQLQQIGATVGPGESSSEIRVPTSSKLLETHPLQLGLPFQPYNRNGAQTDGCEKPHKVDGVYQSSLDVEQRRATLSGFMDPHTAINSLNKAGELSQLWGCSSMPDVLSQFQKLHLNTAQRGINVPQQLQSMSGKMPFSAVAPEEDLVSIVFNLPRKDNGNGGGGEATSMKENNGGGGGVHDNSGGGKNGNSEQPQNTKSVAPGAAAAVGDGPGPFGGMPPPLAAGMVRPKMWLGGAGSPGMHQMAGGFIHNGNIQQPGGRNGDATQCQGMPAGVMPASGYYQGGAGAGRSVPSEPETRQAAMVTGNLAAQQQEQYYTALMQQLGMGGSSGRMEALLIAMAGGGPKEAEQYYTALMQQLGMGGSSGEMETPSGGMEKLLIAMAGGGPMDAEQYYTALMQQEQQRHMASWSEMMEASAMVERLRFQQREREMSSLMRSMAAYTQQLAYTQQREREMLSLTEALELQAMALRNQMAQQYTPAMQQQQRGMSSSPETLLAAMASRNQGSGTQPEKNLGPNRNG